MYKKGERYICMNGDETGITTGKVYTCDNTHDTDLTFLDDNKNVFFASRRDTRSEEQYRYLDCSEPLEGMIVQDSENCTNDGLDAEITRVDATDIYFDIINDRDCLINWSDYAVVGFNLDKEAESPSNTFNYGDKVTPTGCVEYDSKKAKYMVYFGYVGGKHWVRHDDEDNSIFECNSLQPYTSSITWDKLMTKAFSTFTLKSCTKVTRISTFYPDTQKVEFQGVVYTLEEFCDAADLYTLRSNKRSPIV